MDRGCRRARSRGKPWEPGAQILPPLQNSAPPFQAGPEIRRNGRKQAAQRCPALPQPEQASDRSDRGPPPNPDSKTLLQGVTRPRVTCIGLLCPMHQCQPQRLFGERPRNWLALRLIGAQPVHPRASPRGSPDPPGPGGEGVSLWGTAPTDLPARRGRAISGSTPRVRPAGLPTRKGRAIGFGLRVRPAGLPTRKGRKAEPLRLITCESVAAAPAAATLTQMLFRASYRRYRARVRAGAALSLP